MAASCIPSAAFSTVAPASSAPGDLRPPRVDAHLHAERREGRNDRRQPVPLLLPVHHRGDIGRALPAQVDGVGAVGQQLPGPATAAPGLVAIESEFNESGLAFTTP